jgi:hypothetical protein
MGYRRHDKVLRRLRKLGIKVKEKIEGKVKEMLREAVGEVVLILDDTVLDKMWGKATVWVYKLYSSKHRKVIGGIGLVMLLAVVGKWRIPLGFRIYKRKEDGKSRIDLALEMLMWAIEELGIKPSAVVMDSWYASRKILQYLHQKGVRYMTRIKKNRLVMPLGANAYLRVDELVDDIPPEGVLVKMKGVGIVRLFAFPSRAITNGGSGSVKFYVSNDVNVSREELEEMMKMRWQIEEVFKVLKQVFSLYKFFVRHPLSILGFIGVSIIGFLLAEKIRFIKGFSHYELQQRLRRLGRSALYHRRNPLLAL